jgi:CRISPR-associated protein Cas5d
MKPIKFENIRRNEVSAKASASKAKTAMRTGLENLYICTSDCIQQRSAAVLKDVRYIIDAHFEITDKAGPQDVPEKFYNMILRRLRRGQCFHQPYLGAREFPAKVQLFDGKDEDIVTAYEGETRDLGLMIYDMDYLDMQDIKPMYFRAVLKNGVLDLRDCEVFK